MIGWPVEQVKAPALFNAYFTRHNIDARVIPLKIAPDAYIAAVCMLMSVETPLNLELFGWPGVSSEAFRELEFL
ncbi:hypothetical protein ACFS07_15875 [Undibacterium arcticum]